ncbi:hypothetical protein CBR_g34099 [Chara braunii]|uniref:Reverse transcriptase domain-containing protein n=1 Tax=Chara braunii TaxID=69332 RepID=A0A388LI18_CHABU|nr:hypothetical protein CBR_g34099 [Chara braunii]|eukprot:GBG81917.1 hypothetical protein CBR_g34099 [Chara braunii]
MTQDENESVRAFGKRFQKISNVRMKKGKISEVERCTNFIGHLSKGRQKSILRDLPRDKLDFAKVLKLAIKAEADDYKDLVWRGMRRSDFSLCKEYATDRCPDFKDYPWSEKNEAMTEEVKEIRDMVKGLTRQVTEIVTSTRATTYRDKPGVPYSLRWDRRNTDSWRSVEDKNPRTLTDYRARERERDDEPWRRRDDEIDRDRRARETYGPARRLDDYSRSPHYEADGVRGGSRGRWEYERGDRDGDRRAGSRGRYDRRGIAREQHDDSRGWYDRGDRRDESRGRYDHGDRRNDSRGRYEQGGSGGDRRKDSRGRNERGGYGASSDPYPKSPDPRAVRGSTSRSADDRPPTPRNSCVYCRGDDHIKRDCPDLKRAIDEGLVVLDDRKDVKWADDLGDISMFPSMKENVETRRVKASKGKEPVRSWSINITFEGDMATTPIRVAATKSARGSTSRKTDTDYVMTEKNGQRIDGEEVILSPRKAGSEECSILEYLAASKPARDELQMITRKTHIPLSEEVQVAPKADAPTVAVSEVTARADRMATVLIDGMKGVPQDKFYILGSGTVEAILNDGAVLYTVIDNDSEAVIIDEDVAEAALAVDAGPSDRIKTLPISDRAVRFREKKYGPLLIEGEGRIVEVEDLGSRLIVDGNSYPNEADEEFGGVVSERERVIEILKTCDKPIAFSDAERGRVDPRYAKPARIYTIPHVPWNDAGWKYPQKEKEEVIAFLKEKMASHVAEPSDSAYVNRWFFLRKPNGKIRWIQDLQKVNVVAIRDVGSVPHADLLAEGAAGRSIYSVCDLFSSYDEVPLDSWDRHLTAMHTPLRLIQMMVVPMGWTNGVAVFQRAMVAVLKGFIPDKVEVFLDDFL